MNYFRCTVGGGKGNTVTVTCAEEFAGLTITLAKTGKTYTKICPSTAPYEVTFYGVEVGTYTVSCTVDGQTYSETVIVQDISCVLNYGFKWQTWVDTASQLDSSDYDTLDEVLADEKALRELFLEHACVDYMAESTTSNADLETIINDDYCAKWINLSDYALDFLHANEVIADLMDEADKYGYGEWALMPQVPTMTSNTVPFGEAFASSFNGSGAEAWKAFDNVSTTYWSPTRTQQGTINSYIGYDFITPKVINRVIVTFYNATYSASEFKIQGSNDNNTWTDLSHITGNTDASVAFNFSNSNAYRYYRFLTLATNSNYEIDMLSLQFYAWAPKGNVPVMTSNTAPYGEVSGSNTYSTYYYYNVFDGNETTLWSTNNNASTNYVQYKSANPICAKRVSLRVSEILRISSIVIQASNDGFSSDTHDLKTINVSELTDGVTYTTNITNDSYYLYHRAKINYATNSGVSFHTLQFYGRELKVSVPTMTSNTAPFGVASASSVYQSGYEAYKAFDDNSSTLYNSTAADTTKRLVYKFINPVIIKHFAATFNGTSVAAYKIQASNDSSTWVDLYDGTNSQNVNSGVQQSTGLTNATAYQYYAFQRQQTFDNTKGLAVYTLQFYGLDYSEKEFEAGTTKKWLYDHGVELVTAEPRKGSGVYTTATITKNSSDIYISNNNFSSGAADKFANVAFKTTVANYSLLRAKMGDYMAIPANCEIGISSNVDVSWPDNGTATSTGQLALTLFSNASISLPNGIFIDVSNINNGNGIIYGVEWSPNVINSLKELWLE